MFCDPEHHLFGKCFRHMEKKWHDAVGRRVLQVHLVGGAVQGFCILAQSLSSCSINYGRVAKSLNMTIDLHTSFFSSISFFFFLLDFESTVRHVTGEDDYNFIIT